MERFVILTWDTSNETALADKDALLNQIKARPPAFDIDVRYEGVAVLYAHPRAKRAHSFRCANVDGVIIGSMFQRAQGDGEHAHRTSLSDDESKRIDQTGGRFLADRFWGRYVAVWRNREAQTTHVFRDPSGVIPCFFRKIGSVHLFFSHLEDVTALSSARFSINWKYLTAHTLYGRCQIRDTGLNEVAQLHAGERFSLTPRGVASEFLWRPKDIIEGSSIERFGEATELARTTIARCVEAQSAPYTRIIPEASGGLDSTIVLACLKVFGGFKDLQCLNFYADTPGGDERFFANEAAARAGYTLLERKLSPENVRLDRLTDLPVTPTPLVSLSSIENDLEQQRIARDTGIEAYFSGACGDAVLYQVAYPLIVSDYLRSHKPGPRLFRLLHETAMHCRQPIWSVLRANRKFMREGRRTEPLLIRDGEDTLLSQGAVESVDTQYVRHPWVAESGDLPIGKFIHVVGLVDCQSQTGPYGRSALVDLVYPLYSQPVVELFLRIPSYVLTAGARDRAVARKAFADLIPPSISGRRSKGKLTGYYNTILMVNAPYIRDLLMDGLLVSNGILDRARLETHLSDDALVRGDHSLSILDYLSVEHWAQSWEAASGKAAA